MITLAITTYNRVDITIESFSSILNNPYIDEIVIVDDCSDLNIFNDLKSKINNINNDKIKLYRNNINLKPFLNKVEAIKYSKNEWVILLDSDNKITDEYVNLVNSTEKNENTLYLPETLLHFNGEIISNFHRLKNNTINLSNIKKFLGEPETSTIMNVGNFFVNKKKYLEVTLNNNIESYLQTNDALYFSYLWIINGNNIKILGDLVYHHRQHEGSWYLNNMVDCNKNTNEIINRLKIL